MGINGISTVVWSLIDERILVKIRKGVGGGKRS